MNEKINRRWATITKINKEFDEIYHKIAVHYNLSDSNFWVLYALYEKKDSCTQKELCDYWCYTKQTINSAIKSLEKLGYINRGYEENNKFNKKIVLTKLGKQIAEKIIKEVMEIEDKAYSCISESDLDFMIDLLQKPLDCLKNEANKIFVEGKGKNE